GRRREESPEPPRPCFLRPAAAARGGPARSPGPARPIGLTEAADVTDATSDRPVDGRVRWPHTSRTAMGKPWMEIGRYGGVGLEFVLTIFLVAALGHYLDDRYWNHGSWGMGVGFLLGVAVAFRNLMRTASNMQRDIERAEAR